MTLIEQKLVEAYAVLVLAEKYVLKEEDRKSTIQKLVPDKFINAVEIKVAERTVEALEGAINGL